MSRRRDRKRLAALERSIEALEIECGIIEAPEPFVGPGKHGCPECDEEHVFLAYAEARAGHKATGSGGAGQGPGSGGGLGMGIAIGVAL